MMNIFMLIMDQLGSSKSVSFSSFFFFSAFTVLFHSHTSHEHHFQLLVSAKKALLKNTARYLLSTQQQTDKIGNELDLVEDISLRSQELVQPKNQAKGE